MTMNLRNLLVVSIMAAAAGVGSSSALAWTDLGFSINIGPPPPVYEAVPPPRAGYVWAPGYWDGHRHRWHQGYWMRERHGYAWAPYHWEHRGDRWYFRGGHWDRHYG
jgi:hypothetical protein